MQAIIDLDPHSRGVAPASALRMRGVTAYALGAALDSGSVVRVRRGWFADRTADARIVAAVRVGGSLTCVSALDIERVWVLSDACVHVSVGRNASRLRPVVADTRIHWRSRAGVRSSSVDGIAESLAVAAGCLTREFALVAIDCALNRKLVTLPQLELAFAGEPAARLLARADPGSQSGLETLGRVRLRSKGITLRTQVWIPGVGRVDVLIGDRLVLELDGYGFHATGESFETDRHRDLALHALGYRVVRLSYRQVMYGWPEAERVILEMVRRGDHRWPRRGR